MFVGDGQQAIYPGGFSLRSVGLDVRGRSFLLRTNWRNTQSIAAAAEAVMGDLPFGDLEDESAPRPAREAPLPRRRGELPELHLVGSDEHGDEVLRELLAGGADAVRAGRDRASSAARARRGSAASAR